MTQNIDRTSHPQTMDFVERMAVAGHAAPRLRRRALAPRLVSVTDKNGNVVRFSTDVEVGQRVLARHSIEFGLQDGKAEVVACARCAKPTQKTRAIPVICPSCKGNVVSKTVITLNQGEVDQVRQLLTSDAPLPDTDWGVIANCLLRSVRGKKQAHTWKVGVAIFEPESAAFERCGAAVRARAPGLVVTIASLLRVALAQVAGQGHSHTQ